MTITELESKAMSLSPEVKLRLVDRLLTSLCPDPSLTEVWRIEIDRRLEEFDQGRMMSKPVEEAITKARVISQEDTTRLIRDLIEELDTPPDSEVETLWGMEIERRVREMNPCAEESQSLEDLKADLRARRRR